MLIGAMNHPARDVMDEIGWMAEMDLEFLDLTLEPPRADVSRVNAARVREALERHGLKVVGHTAYYLPLASPYESLRRAAVEEVKRCLDVFARVGVKWANLHPDRHGPFQSRDEVMRRNIRTLEELTVCADDLGVGLMIENLPRDFNSAQQLSELLEPLPKLGLHLDIGHCNLGVEENSAREILAAYGDRLKHVHLHDNKGGSADLHLPLGAGSMDVAAQVRLLHGAGYDDTITLEVFSPDRHFLAYSRDTLRRLWNECGEAARRAEAAGTNRH